MDGKSPADIIESAEEEKYSKAEDARTAFDFFNDTVDGMVERPEAVEAIADEYDWDEQRAARAITGLVDDTLDPVQQVGKSDGKWVGIIDYQTFDDDGMYGFVEYDATFGKRKVVVCARCVQQYKYATEPFRAVEGVGRHDIGCEYADLIEHGREHYAEVHSDHPDEIDVGASLVSGTTISGNEAWHAGNDGQGSGLNADTLQGKAASELSDINRDRNGNAVITDSQSDVASFSLDTNSYSSENFGHGTYTAPSTDLYTIQGRTKLSAGSSYGNAGMKIKKNGATLTTVFTAANSGYTTTTETTYTRVTSGDSVQYVPTETGEGYNQSINFDAFGNDRKTGEYTQSVNFGQDRDPTWLITSSGSPGNGNFNGSVAIDGQDIGGGENYVGAVTGGQSFTHKVSYSNVTSSTGQSHTVTVEEGERV